MAGPPERMTRLTTTLLKNAALLDTERCTITPGQSLLITGDIIARIGADVADAGADQVIDCGGRTLMPGLIDCHVHVNTTEQNTIENTILPSSLVAARTVKTMNGMLMRGFTAVRDMGGADIGYIRAVEEGTFIPAAVKYPCVDRMTWPLIDTVDFISRISARWMAACVILARYSMQKPTAAVSKR